MDRNTRTIARHTQTTVRFAVLCSVEAFPSLSVDAYFADLVQAYREELIELYYLGCRHVQFDDPTFAFFCADSTIEGMEKAGVDSEKLFNRYVRVYNEILAHRPSDFTVGLHTCRGNYRVNSVFLTKSIGASGC